MEEDDDEPGLPKTAEQHSREQDPNKKNVDDRRTRTKEERERKAGAEKELTAKVGDWYCADCGLTREMA